MRKLTLCTFALCLGFASITQAQPTTTKIRFKGATASGSAESVDDKCFFASFGFTASDEFSKSPTDTSTTKKLVVGYGGRDLCRKLSFGGNQTVALTVPIANQSTVTFEFDFVVDYANTDTNERFQKRMKGTVTITATGDFEKSRRTDILQTRELRRVTRSKGNTREATLTLNAKLDGVTQSLPITSAELGTVKNGTVETTSF